MRLRKNLPCRISRRCLVQPGSGIDYDVNGEWGCYLILDEFLNNATESKQAAAGWGGDRFAIYRGGNPARSFIAQLTAWDTPPMRKNSSTLMRSAPSKRYPDAKELSASGERIEWQTSEWRSVASCELRGSERVAMIEGSRRRPLRMIYFAPSGSKDRICKAQNRMKKIRQWSSHKTSSRDCVNLPMNSSNSKPNFVSAVGLTRSIANTSKAS